MPICGAVNRVFATFTRRKASAKHTSTTTGTANASALPTVGDQEQSSHKRMSFAEQRVGTTGETGDGAKAIVQPEHEISCGTDGGQGMGRANNGGYESYDPLSASTQRKKHGKWCRFKHHLPFGKKHKTTNDHTTFVKSEEGASNIATGKTGETAETSSEDIANDIEGEEQPDTLAWREGSTTRKPAGLPSVRAAINAQGKEGIRREQAEHERQMREQAIREPQERDEQHRALKSQKSAEKRRMKELSKECKRKAKEEKRTRKNNA